jgi:hypothetical protein
MTPLSLLKFLWDSGMTQTRREHDIPIAGREISTMSERLCWFGNRTTHTPTAVQFRRADWDSV